MNKIAGFTSGGTYSATPTGLSIDANTGAINVASSSPGNYTITYSVAATGCNPVASGTASFTINAGSTPVTGFSYSPTSVCSNAANPVLNRASGFTSGGNYSATPAGLSIDANTGAINVATSSPGNYTITYSVAATGCNPSAGGTASFTINAGTTPVTGFSYAPATVCANAANPVLNKTTGFTSGGNYSATPAGLSIDANTGAINVASSSPGNYTITYSVAASGCNPAGSGTATLLINAAGPSPVTAFNYGTDTLCTGSAAIIPIPAAGFTAGGLFQSIPAGLSINSSTGSISPASSAPGTYTISYTVSPGICTSGASHQENLVVSVKPAKPIVNPASAEICVGNSVNLTATGNAVTEWYETPSLSDPVQTGPRYTISPITNQKLFVLSRNGSCRSDTTEVQILVQPFPEKPSLGNDTSICSGETLLLNPGSYSAYRWQDGSTQQLFTVSRSGLYSVTVGRGCQSSDSISVIVLAECADIFFPGAFTPNGDGKNETFGPSGNLFLVRNYELSIFNRYGQRIFFSRNPVERWDGGEKSNRSGPETYTWMARYLFRGKQTVKKGSLLLIK